MKMRTFRILHRGAVLALSLWAAAAAAQTPAAKPKQTPPPPQPEKEIHFPAFEQKTLPNGLRVVVVEHHETPTVSLQLQVRAGKAFTPAGKAGLPSATAELLRQGTQSRSAQQIAEAIDSVGGNLVTYGSWDSAIGIVQMTSDQLDLGLDLLSDVTLRPSFPAEEIERWRRQTLNGLRVQLEDAGYLADASFERAVFGDHPYGLPETGTPASVQGITRDDMAAFHREHYVPNQGILAVVGDVKPADAFAKVERAFGAWAKGQSHETPKVQPSPAGKTRIVVVDKPDAVQTEIRMGQVGLAYTDPDYFVSEVYNSILGGGASARLYLEIRQKRGLSYGAGSDFLYMLQPGAFTANTFTKTESTVEALDTMLEVLRGMQEQLVPKEELEERKTYLTGVFPMEIETAEGIAAKVVQAMKYGLGREYLESYRGRLDAVTAEQVKSFASRRIQAMPPLIVLVGNASAFRADLEKKHGAVEVIPYQELDLLRADLRQPKAEPKPAG